jgi:acetolactate synthase I/II/III large subunit
VDIEPAPDYARLAEACGAYGEKLEDPGKIQAALERGLKRIADGETVLLDVMIDPGIQP